MRPRLQLVSRVWNGRWGRLARRDIRLSRTEIWTVEAWKGGHDERSNRWECADEIEARAMIGRLLETGGSGWRDITDAVQRHPASGAAPPAVQQ